MTIHRLRATALALTLVALLLGHAARADQEESPVACVAGGVTELAYGDHTTGCSVSVGGQQGLSFYATAGDTLRLNGISHTSGFDPNVRIFDPMFVELPGTGCTVPWNETCSFSIEFLVEKTGSFTLSVNDSGNNEGGSYTLQLETIHVSPDAVWLDYDQSESESSNPQTDVDFFEFHGTAGTDVRINLRTTTSGFDAHMEIYAPNGDLIAEGAAEGAGCSVPWNAVCSFQKDLEDLAETGTYTLLLSDAGLNENGTYRLSLWCIDGACENEPGDPIPEGDLVMYVDSITGSLSPVTDARFYRFHGKVGTDVRLNVRSTTSGVDPRIEIRDPNGDLVADLADGAGCTAAWNATCSSTLDLEVLTDGVHTMIVSDVNVDETGSYQMGLHCMKGICDSDADGMGDRHESVLTYGDLFDREVSLDTDVDFFRFGANPASIVEISLVSLTSGLDPWFELRDPNGVLVDSGPTNGAGCSAAWNATCSTVYPLPAPIVAGDYTIALYDGGVNESGTYRIGVHCIAGVCPDATPNLVADNCIEVPNGPLAAGPGGHEQRDEDADGFGTACDADYDGDGFVGLSDFARFSTCWDEFDPICDHNGDGMIGLPDWSVFGSLFGKRPGPSGLGCYDGLCAGQE